MTPISEEEAQLRLAAIERGPWADGVREAKQILVPRDPLGFSTSVTGYQRISLEREPSSAANKIIDQRLKAILRAHYEDANGITSKAEIKIRDALDEALLLPQLYELAVQTGYLPVETVLRPARKILTDLCWSSAVQNYVKIYDYIAVPMLAVRVDISGFGHANPPEPNMKAALHFAAFLAHLRSFYANKQIQAWVHFLDDYIQEEDEQGKLRRFLGGGQNPAPVRTQELLLGCELFVSSLASTFHVLDDEELGRFGLIHAYWLQKFFGYKRDGAGYVKDNAAWGGNDSWARTVAESPHLAAEGIDNEIADILRRQFREQVYLLNKTFEAVMKLVKPTQKKSTAAS